MHVETSNVSINVTVISSGVSKNSNFRGKVWRLSLKEVNDEMYAGAAKAASDPGHIPLNKLPSHKRLKSDFSGDMGSKPWTVDDLNSHHIVERRYQGRLGIPEAQWDDVPGFIVSTVDHTGPGGLAHRLRQVIGNSNDPAVIIAGHRQVYLEKGLNDLWTVTEKWLISKGFTIPP
jgi:hypothetical protein